MNEQNAPQVDYFENRQVWKEREKVMAQENGMRIFSFESKQVRIVEKNGTPWWVAKDVCEILALSDVSMTISRLDSDEKGTNKVCTPGGMQDMTIINESGLYALIIRSNKPEAKKFRKWVTSEVLPTLRKTGEYATPDKQKEKAKKHDELAAKRLEIMEKNANWRIAKLILEGIDKFKEVMTPESKTVFMAKYAELTSGQDMTHILPAASEKWHSAAEIGEICGVSSAKIGRVSNQNCIKAPDGESNEYGTWIRSKSQNSPREVMTWVYSEKAVDWFKEFFKIEKTA
jgi:prophage antirepressor-like protein